MSMDATPGTGLLARPAVRSPRHEAPVRGAYGGARLVVVKLQQDRRLPQRTGLLRELR
jgi:hypothetical protein